MKKTTVSQKVCVPGYLNVLLLKKLSTLIILLFLIDTVCTAQEYLWAETPDSVVFYNQRNVAADNQGNIYKSCMFQGSFDADPGPGVSTLTSNGLYDIGLVKYDPNGNFIWAKSFGGAYDEFPGGIVVDASGNIILTGTFKGTVDFDPGPGTDIHIADGGLPGTNNNGDGYLAKFNSSGVFLWARTIGSGTYAQKESYGAIDIDNNGNIYSFGLFHVATDIDPGPAVSMINPTAQDEDNGFLLKLDPNGNYVNGFSLNFGTYGLSELAALVLKVSNGAVCIYGRGPFVYTFSKYDLDLNLAWSKQAYEGLPGNSNGYYVHAMAIDLQGNITLGGHYSGTFDFDPGPAVFNFTAPNNNYNDIALCSFDNNGNFRWARTAPTEGYGEVINDIEVNTLNGDLYVAGEVDNPIYFDGVNNPEGYVNTGHLPNGNNRYSGFVECLDANGNFKSVSILSGGRGSYITSMVIDHQSNVILTGNFFTDVDFDPSFQTTAHITTLSPNSQNFLCKWAIIEPVDFYNTKANLGLENLGTWSSALDGTGPSPQNFTKAGQHFNVINQANAHFSGVFGISGFDLRMIVGDGVSATNLTILAGSSYINPGTWVDVLNNGTLAMYNNIFPVLQRLKQGSSVDFAQAGISITDTINIPLHPYYNLKLTGGLKNFSKGLTTITNDLIADGVLNLGGSTYDGTGFSNVDCQGNVTFLNGTSFEVESVIAAKRRFVLQMNGSGPVQTINSNGTHIRLIALSRNNISACNIVLSPGTNITIGASIGGGLYIPSPATTLTTTGGIISLISNAAVAGYHHEGRINSNGTSFEVSRTSDQYNSFFDSDTIGTLRFTPGSTINNFSMSSYVSPTAPDKLNIDADVTVTGILSLASGYLNIFPGNKLSMSATASVAPGPNAGSTGSFIIGAVRKTGTTAFTFPLGWITDNGVNGFYMKYAPVDMTNYSGNDTYTVNYTNQSYPDRVIDPTTLAINPAYGISGKEYWEITPAVPGGAVDIQFHYTDDLSGILQPASIAMAHFDGTDWNNLGGIPGASNSLTSGDVLVTGVNVFSPFTFGGTADVVVPVKLTSFSVKKQNISVQLYWTTEKEINSKSFIIERSSDQIKWNEIIRLNAAGNSSVKINYNATDHNPARGINYYRLKQVDVDGRFNYSEIRSVYFGNDVNVVVAPNPAKDKVTVYLPGNPGVSIKIFNVKGQLVKQVFSGEESVQIRLTDLSRGMYTIKIIGKNINEVRKLIVE